MQHFFFPDNTVFVNFAWVDRLDLLQSYLAGRGRITEAVKFEVERSKSHVANLHKLDVSAWFDDVIEFDDTKDVDGIDFIRRRRFGGSELEPLKHLGESQTIWALTTIPAYASSCIVTDDEAAYNLAKGQDCRVAHTIDVLRHLVAYGEINAQEAFEIYVAMTNAGPDGRSFLENPTSARDFM
ncbi:hypothetical protein [Microbacterium sp. Yaish 1]|uniref:hypothetical protein n=1 Tax=Microbacterium sp. Yaish 1 TaxID=2025014 RepID=UPI000B945AD0|nr:hypothetical protein [Microbacterium sp. Yaish 1]OYC97221.1 hypothetical protein CI089_01315 [Microbacterium sp. Yaish 1]